MSEKILSVLVYLYFYIANYFSPNCHQRCLVDQKYYMACGTDNL